MLTSSRFPAPDDNLGLEDEDDWSLLNDTTKTRHDDSEDRRTQEDPSRAVGGSYSPPSFADQDRYTFGSLNRNYLQT